MKPIHNLIWDAIALILCGAGFFYTSRVTSRTYRVGPTVRNERHATSAFQDEISRTSYCMSTRSRLEGISEMTE